VDETLTKIRWHGLPEIVGEEPPSMSNFSLLPRIPWLLVVAAEVVLPGPAYPHDFGVELHDAAPFSANGTKEGVGGGLDRPQAGWQAVRYRVGWYVGGVWYFGPPPFYPYYPYPLPAYPVYVPPPVVAAPAPTGPPPAQVWYYCDKPAGYYPYVDACDGPWRPVPAAPTDSETKQ
jgi:hypothetical protein